MIALPAGPHGCGLAASRPSALALAAALLLAAGCAPNQETDCDQLLADEKYSRVINTCDDPSAVGMAYLGLAGFDFIDFLAADDPNDVAGLLSVAASNVTEKRELINQAIRTLVPVDTSKQGFILLLASYLGLSVTYSEYLDNGAGGASPFDNEVEDSEVEQATGLAVQSPAPAVPFGLDASATFQMIESGAPYVVNCGADASALICDDNPGGSLTMYADTAPVAGAGLDVTGTTITPVPANADVANEIVMLLGMDLPITYDEDKLDRLSSFLSEGTLDEDFPEQNPDLFPIGVLGYLDLTDYANLKLIEFAGGDVENGEPAESTLDTAIDTIRARLDNGAACFKDGATDPLKIAAAIPLNLLYAVYLAAPGTEQIDVPGDQDFSPYNIVERSALDADGDGDVDTTETLVGGPYLTPNGALYEFGGGALEMGYKVLYPTVSPLGAFDRTFATPRIDETPSAFRTDFEFLPHLAPNAAETLDGTVEMIEVICTSESE